MREKILIVEDDPIVIRNLSARIAALQDDVLEVLVAKNVEDAKKEALAGDLTYALVDLQLPEKEGHEAGEPDNERGFEVLSTIHKHNPFALAFVMTRFEADKGIAGRLARECGRDFVRAIFNKNDDRDYIDRICNELGGIRELEPAFKATGLRVIHPLERRLARRLREVASRYQSSWPTPCVLLLGPPGSGKDQWARALIEIRNVLSPAPSRVNALDPIDCGVISTLGAGDSAKIELFGSHNYQRTPATAGPFENSTVYASNGGVDYQRSNFVVLTEFGNLPHECQRLLLQTMDSNPHNGGRITRAGAGRMVRHIGCGFILTTNAPLKSRIAESADAEAGELRADLARRIQFWISVPSFQEMGSEAFIAHLKSAIDEECEKNWSWAATAKATLKLEFQRRPAVFNQDSIRRIRDAFVHTGESRLRWDHLVAGIDESQARSEQVPPSTIETGESQPVEKIREDVAKLFGSELSRNDWNLNDFSQAFRSMKFSNQKQFEAFVASVRRMAGTGRGLEFQRGLFEKAIGYKGSDLGPYLSQIVRSIVSGSNGKLKAIPRK